MTGKQLKNSILQLAISGKLVPQDPSDEPASELLKRIRKEKEALVKQGKLKKKDLVSEPIGDDEIPFEIPESWEWVRLGDIVYNNGQKKPDKKFNYIDIGSINNKKQKLNYEDNIIEAKNAPSRARKIVDIGDIIYSTVRPYLHNMAIIDKSFSEESIASTGFAVFKTVLFYNKYLFYYLLSPSFDEYANDGDKAKGVAYPIINDKQLYKSPIPLPPIAEQHRIVAKIEELMPLVEQFDAAQTELDKLNASLPDALKKSILQQASCGKLVPQDSSDEPASELLKRIRKEKESLVKQGKLKKKDLVSEPIADDEIPFDIPESWEWCRLNDLLSVVSDGTHKTPNYVDKGIPFLSVQNISSGKLTMEKIKYITYEEHKSLCERIKPQVGDILVCRIGTLGKAIEIDWNFEFSIFVSLGLLRTVNRCVNPYIIYFINSHAGHQWIDKVKVGGGTHTYKINLGDFPNMLIPLPPIAEQHRIVAKIEELFKTIDSTL